MVEMEYARHVKDKDVVHVSKVERGKACGCVCLDCGDPVVAKKGEIKEWHFSHVGGMPNSLSSCSGESVRHKAAKDILMRKCKSVRVNDKEAWPCGHVELEKKMDGLDRVFDALVWKDKEKTGNPLVVEFLYSHAKDEQWRQEVFKANLASVEIDLDWDELPDENQLEALIESKAKRKQLTPGPVCQYCADLLPIGGGLRWPVDGEAILCKNCWDTEFRNYEKERQIEREKREAKRKAELQARLAEQNAIQEKRIKEQAEWEKQEAEREWQAWVAEQKAIEEEQKRQREEQEKQQAEWQKQQAEWQKQQAERKKQEEIQRQKEERERAIQAAWIRICTSYFGAARLASYLQSQQGTKGSGLQAQRQTRIMLECIQEQQKRNADPRKYRYYRPIEWPDGPFEIDFTQPPPEELHNAVLKNDASAGYVSDYVSKIRP